jgi:hypothetical protein
MTTMKKGPKLTDSLEAPLRQTPCGRRRLRDWRLLGEHKSMYARTFPSRLRIKVYSGAGEIVVSRKKALAGTGVGGSIGMAGCERHHQLV